MGHNRKRHTIEDISFPRNYVRCHDGWEGIITTESFDEEEIKKTWRYHTTTPEIFAKPAENVWSKKMTIDPTLIGGVFHETNDVEEKVS